MTAFLEVHAAEGRDVVVLEGARCSIGSAPANDIVIAADRRVSRLHAAVEPYSGGWGIRDLGSRNGTFVNGERVMGERSLRHGDEVRLGDTRILFRSSEHLDLPSTEAAAAAPLLTRRERDVLVELCRPVLSDDLFTEPATVRGIAERLVITEAAVKHHLGNLYDKFGIVETDRRRIRLANDAIKRGAVTLGDLRPETPQPERSPP